MARPLDLERVKQAWQLRRQGRHSKDVAQALNLSLRQVHNYLSLDWLAQRCLRVLAQGRADEVNEQLTILWDLGQAAPGRETEGAVALPGDLAGPDTGVAGVVPSICRAPQVWPDVAQLESWGVPRSNAPGFLSAWRRAHRRGSHQLCAFWGLLTSNVQVDIPFPDAYDLAMASWLADRWGFDLLKAVTELYRLYRPWEGAVHQRVYLKEVRAAISEGSQGRPIAPGAPAVELAALFDELPRRFLYGLPRRLTLGGPGPPSSEDGVNSPAGG